MIRSFVRMNRLGSHPVASSALLMLSLLIATPAWADYTPSAPSAPSSPTTNTGRRGGCLGESAAELSVLAPKGHVGQTVSSHPTLVWYIPEDQPTPLEFFLYDTTEPGQRQLVYKTALTSTPGLMSLTLPDEQPGLEVGHQYSWQVVLLCNPNRPSSALVTTAALEVIDLPTDLSNQLSQLDSTRSADLDSYYQQQSDLYADAGVWYDALAVLLQQSSASSEPAVLSLLNELLAYEASHNNPDDVLQTVVQALQSGS